MVFGEAVGGAYRDAAGPCRGHPRRRRHEKAVRGPSCGERAHQHCDDVRLPRPAFAADELAQLLDAINYWILGRMERMF